MRPEGPEGPSDIEITPAIAVAISLAAVFAQILLMVFLVRGLGAAPTASFGIAALVAFGAGLAVAAPFLPDPPARSLGVCAAPLRAWLAVPLLLPSLVLASELDNLLKALVPLPEALAVPSDYQVPFAELILVEVFVLPFVREIFFRGALQPQIVRVWGSARGVAGAAAIAGVASALMLSPWAVAHAASAALVLGVLRQCSGSILPGLVLAALFGAVGVLASEQVFGIPGFDDVTAAHTPLIWLLGAAVFTAGGLAVCASGATKLDGPPSADGGPSRSDETRS